MIDPMIDESEATDSLVANDEDTLTAEVLIGEDADKFMRSELGRTIVGIAEQDAEAAMYELKQIDPNNINKIRELQNVIWRAESFGSWLHELIKRGEQALSIFDHDRGKR